MSVYWRPWVRFDWFEVFLSQLKKTNGVSFQSVSSIHIIWGNLSGDLLYGDLYVWKIIFEGFSI